MKNLRGTVTTLVILSACSGKVIDVGSHQGGAAGSATGGSGGGSVGGTNGTFGAGGSGVIAAAGSAGQSIGAGGADPNGGYGAAGSTNGDGAGGFGGGGSTGLGGSEIFGGAAGASGTMGDNGSLGAGGTGIAPWPTDDTCAGGERLPIVGTWDGYIENYIFPSGSDAVHITVTAANDAHLCGKVTLGEPKILPPAVDPNVGYPPGFFANGGAGGASGYDGAEEGFAMTILNGQSTSTRVQFQVDPMELWRAWCDLQTSYPYPPSGGYECIPYTVSATLGTGGASSGTVGPNGCSLPNGQSIDCGKFQLCALQTCTCSATGCSVNPQGNIAFDLHVQDANSLSGSATVAGIHNVYLGRTQ
jgi:hypothetical protein